MTAIAAIILAAGKGTRMKSDLHKVLHPIAGRPMLDHLLASFEALAPERLVIVAGDRKEQLDAHLAERDIAVAIQEPQLGTAHAALQAKQALDGFTGRIMVCFGDCPMVQADTVRRLSAMLDEGAKVAVLGFRPADPAAYGRVIADDDGTVRKMVEFKDASEDERACALCNAGPIMAEAADMWRLLGTVSNDNAQGEYYLPDVATIAIAEGSPVKVVETDEAEVAGVNSRADLARAEAQWQELKRSEMMDSGVTLKAPETIHFSWDTQIEADVTIGPNAVFGPGVSIAKGAVIHPFCHIEGATIGKGTSVGPFARLRPGAELQEGSKIGNFVEMKKAVLGPGAKASHLTYLGDTTVGAKANIGAGTITCNYDGYFKHKTVIEAGAFIGSNSALVAPVTIGRDAIVGAGSTVTRDVDDGELRIERAEQLVKPGWADRFHDTMKKKKASEQG